MASGQSKRFGKNKLLEKWQEKTFFQRALDLTGGDLFTKRVVVTREKEVKNICTGQGISVICHTFSGRNDVVRLGIEYMNEMDGCIFCPCDQPFLSRESLRRLITHFKQEQKGIFRLCFGEAQGAPVLFGHEYYEELSCLPDKCGGSYLIKKYPRQVHQVQAVSERELFDIDTPEDYKWLIQQETME